MKASEGRGGGVGGEMKKKKLGEERRESETESWSVGGVGKT